MTSRDPEDFDPKRRRLMQSALGVGVLGSTAGQAYALGGDGGDGGGGGGGSPDPGDGRGPWVAVTLVTGQTVYVSDDGDDAPSEGDVAGTQRGDAAGVRRPDGEAADGPATDEAGDDGADERVVVVDDDVDGTLHVFERERGVYVVPADVDLDVYDEELFNVDRLLADGLSDEETDAIPVIVRTDADIPDGGAGVHAQSGGFEAGTTLSSIDAVAGAVRKDRATATSRGLAAAPAVDRIHLDVRREAVLDESASAVGAGEAREEFGVDGSGVTVGVVDTGIDDDHPDLAGRVVDEADFTGEGTQDDYGHGTHVAGIAAGDGTESDGEYVGVAPGADLMNVKVLGADGSGRTSTIVAGIEHAVEQGADVVNMSLGGPATGGDDPLVAAVDAAAAEGVLPVVSAGNRYFSADYQTVSSPGVAAGALTVGASDDGESFLFASAAGPTAYDHRVKPDVVAPGVDVTAAGSEGAGEFPYTGKTGTSMSAPHVAGAAALLLEARDDWGQDRVRDALTATATVIQDEDVYRRGAGRIDVGAALDADVLVRDAVTSFGIHTEPTALSAEIAVENRGDEAVDLDVTADLANVQTGEEYGDAVTATPGTVTVPAGGEATVELAVDAVESYGYNAGEVTFDGPAGSYTAVFGFSLGLQFEVERVPLPERSGAGGAFLQGYTHDGAESFASGFGSDGVAVFETFEPSHVEDGVEVSFWSFDPHPTADGNVVTVETTTVGPENTRVVMDETETVPRYLDTDPVSEHEPFHVELFSESVHANFGDGVTQGYTAFGSIPDADTPTWYTPIDEDSTVNVANRYVLVPGPSGATRAPSTARPSTTSCTRRRPSPAPRTPSR